MVKFAEICLCNGYTPRKGRAKFLIAVLKQQPDDLMRRV